MPRFSYCNMFRFYNHICFFQNCAKVCWRPGSKLTSKELCKKCDNSKWESMKQHEHITFPYERLEHIFCLVNLSSQLRENLSLLKKNEHKLVVQIKKVINIRVALIATKFLFWKYQEKGVTYGSLGVDHEILR